MCAFQKRRKRNNQNKSKTTNQLNEEEIEQIIFWRDVEKIPYYLLREKCKNVFKLKKEPSENFIRYLTTNRKDKRRIPRLTNVVLENELLKWYKEMEKACVPVHDISFISKAKEIQEKMIEKDPSIKELKFSNGWLDSFKQRNGIHSKRMVGEKHFVDIEKSIPQIKCIKSIIHYFICEYGLNSIYNSDETGLFYHSLGILSHSQNNQSISILNTKDRVSMLFTVSLDGEKRKPLIIGKSKKPRGYKVDLQDKYNMNYTHQTKSWMTTEIFHKYLKEWDDELEKEEEKLSEEGSDKNVRKLLLIDNCSAHSLITKRTNGNNEQNDYNVLELKHLLVVFLPENTTSIYQTLDMGIINTFKVYYRKYYTEAVIKKFDELKAQHIHESEMEQIEIDETYEIDDGKRKKGNWMKFGLTECFEFIQKAWDSVTSETVINCWRKSTLLNNIQNLVNENYSFDQNGLSKKEQLLKVRTALEKVKPIDDEENPLLKGTNEKPFPQQNETTTPTNENETTPGNKNTIDDEIEAEISKIVDETISNLTSSLHCFVDKRNFVSPFTENDIPLDYDPETTENDGNESNNDEIVHNLTFDISYQEMEESLVSHRKRIAELNLTASQRKNLGDHILNVLGLNV